MVTGLPIRATFQWNHQIPFPVDAEIGPTMGELAEFKLAAKGSESMDEKSNTSSTSAGPRVIVYKGGVSPSVAAVNQHGPGGRKKADVNPSSSDAGEVFSKFQSSLFIIFF